MGETKRRQSHADDVEEVLIKHNQPKCHRLWTLPQCIHDINHKVTLGSDEKLGPQSSR